jgi:hypothetical protein
MDIIDKKRCKITMAEAPRLRRRLPDGRAIGWTPTQYFSNSMRYRRLRDYLRILILTTDSQGRVLHLFCHLLHRRPRVVR